MTTSTDSQLPRVFAAYPSASRLLAETIRGSAATLTSRGVAEVTTWESLQVTGTVMIDTIQAQIRSSDILVAEVGSLNSNVLFEVGYAFTTGKRLWLLVDTTDEQAKKNWHALGLLTSIGFCDYQGDSQRMVTSFSQEVGTLISQPSAWQTLINNIEIKPDARTLFFHPTILHGDAPRSLDRLLSRRQNLVVLRTDEDERGYAPLPWYVEMIARSAAGLVYLLGPNRVRAEMHNARASLLAGMMAGLGRPILMIAEESLTPPIDYQDLLYNFGLAKTLVAKVDAWLDALPSTLSRQPIGLRLTAGLPERFGEYVAEYEADDLPSYFVETAEYQRVLTSGTAIFVGRKGTGKTATMLRAAEALSVDRRNLVSVIKPASYEIESLLQVLRKIPEKDTADFLLSGLWQYLLYCEIAAAAIRDAEARPAGIATGSPMDALRAHLETFDVGISEDFSIRLERAIGNLLADMGNGLPSGVEATRSYIAEKLHGDVLGSLRQLIGDALHDRERVAILIDNLDKAWEHGVDYQRMSLVIFGLLSAIGRVSLEFARERIHRKKVNVTLSAFLRADIFSVVLKYAREPDKIEKLQIRWDDPGLLARVIEDRYKSNVANEDGSDVWSKVFDPHIHGIAARRYLLWRALPRPRDLIHLCNAAVMVAVNNNHVRVSEPDVVDAEEVYSRFAFEALLVESDPDNGLANDLYEFAGASPTLDPTEVEGYLTASGQGDPSERMRTLLRSSFLGLETHQGTFEYSVDENLEKKHAALARRLATERGAPARYRIHPAFRPFLEIPDDDLPS